MRTFFNYIFLCLWSVGIFVGVPYLVASFAELSFEVTHPVVWRFTAGIAACLGIIIGISKHDKMKGG